MRLVHSLVAVYLNLATVEADAGSFLRGV